MSALWNGIVIVILLFACTEEPCRGNETNDELVEKQVVGDPGANFNWPRYLVLYQIDV